MSAEKAEYKIAGAPISRGVCEVPGWGYQLQPDRVLREMRDVGLTATELGPEGFLPSDPSARRTPCPDTGLRTWAVLLHCCCTCPDTTRCRR
jgi:inosose dehydratase